MGTGSSWSRLTSTRDILIDMTNLNRILTPKPANRKDNLKQEFVDIEVEGGMQVHRFVEKLDKVYGLALPMMGNYAGQTVAGVACTSTHGSGYFTGTMVCITSRKNLLLQISPSLFLFLYQFSNTNFYQSGIENDFFKPPSTK